jgi:hypothetical protein
VSNCEAAGQISGEFGGLPAAIPHLFHNTAPSRDLSWEERMLLRRTRKQFKDWEFRLWTDDDLDAIIRDDHAAIYDKYRAITRGILRSDIGRYAVLYRCGGIYADTDYKFTAFPNELINVPCTLPVEAGVSPGGNDGHDEPFRLGNALLASVRGYAFWRDLIEHIFATNSLFQLHAEDPIKTTGPEALTQFWLDRAQDYPDIALPPKVRFYPDLTWSRAGIARSKETVGIHMCWGSWRGRGTLHHIRTVARRKLTCLI